MGSAGCRSLLNLDVWFVYNRSSLALTVQFVFGPRSRCSCTPRFASATRYTPHHTTSSWLAHTLKRLKYRYTDLVGTTVIIGPRPSGLVQAAQKVVSFSASKRQSHKPIAVRPQVCFTSCKLKSVGHGEFMYRAISNLHDLLHTCIKRWQQARRAA